MNNITNTHTKITTTDLIVAAVKKTLSELYDRQVQWNANEYAASNTVLLALLDDSYELYLKCVQCNKHKTALRAFLKAQQLTVNAKTSLGTRVVRAVFGDIRQRAFAYATVLDVAHAENVAAGDLARWVEKNGGIENVRRNKLNTKLTELEQAEQAGTKLDTATAQHTFGMQLSTLDMADDANGGKYSVVLLRDNDNGDADILFATRQQTVVNKALLAAVRKK